MQFLRDLLLEKNFESSLFYKICFFMCPYAFDLSPRYLKAAIHIPETVHRER
jgi:hypothetical protein